MLPLTRPVTQAEEHAALGYSPCTTTDSGPSRQPQEVEAELGARPE